LKIFATEVTVIAVDTQLAACRKWARFSQLAPVPCWQVHLQRTADKRILPDIVVAQEVANRYRAVWRAPVSSREEVSE
jgi:hypothetical protein